MYWQIKNCYVLIGFGICQLVWCIGLEQCDMILIDIYFFIVDQVFYIVIERYIYFDLIMLVVGGYDMWCVKFNLYLLVF